MPKKQVGYIDGFVFVVPKDKLAAYRKMAREGKDVWMKNGALGYKECMLDDAQPEMITFFFPKMVKAKPNETVWFSYIEFESKAHRNKVNKKIHKIMEEQYGDGKDQKFEMPFDMKRMAYGGFSVKVSN